MGHGTLLGEQKQQRPNEIHAVVALINSSTSTASIVARPGISLAICKIHPRTHPYTHAATHHKKPLTHSLHPLFGAGTEKNLCRFFVFFVCLNKFQAHRRCYRTLGFLNLFSCRSPKTSDSCSNATKWKAPRNITKTLNKFKTNGWPSEWNATAGEIG